MAIYSILEGMKRIDVPENDRKNNLPVGTVIKLNGYSDPEYVIVKNLGINQNFSDHGATYLMVDLEKKTFAHKQSYELLFIAEKTSNRIQSYITEKILPPDEVLEYYQAAEQAQRNDQDTKTRLQAERDQLIAKGRELFKKYIPETAQALILGVREIDESDMMTDYFHVSSGETIILGWSTHRRDLFSEMRKHAHLIPETEHLSTAPKVNRNNEERNEVNKSWWNPSDEHREKYSMGRGYYLKASGCYSNGWTIKKEKKYGDWYEGLYVSIAKRCIFGK